MAEMVCNFMANGLKGWYHQVPECQKPRVVVVHGLSEHSGRHLTTIHQLTAAGYECVRFDLRGHGESEGRPQWIDAFEDYVDDVRAIFDWIDAHLPAKPVFLHGHSLGGAICLRFAARNQHKLSGVMVNAPAYKVGDGVPGYKIVLARLLNRLLPGLKMKRNLDITTLSRDPDVIQRCQTDALVRHFNTLRQGCEILRAMPSIIEDVKRITVPILFTHGGQDRLILAHGSQELFDHCASTDKEFVSFKEAYHEIHNDLDREAYFQKLVDWLAAHSA